jgi:hypothetical protein
VVGFEVVFYHITKTFVILFVKIYEKNAITESFQKILCLIFLYIYAGNPKFSTKSKINSTVSKNYPS